MVDALRRIHRSSIHDGAYCVCRTDARLRPARRRGPRRSERSSVAGGATASSRTGARGRGRPRQPQAQRPPTVPHRQRRAPAAGAPWPRASRARAGAARDLDRRLGPIPCTRAPWLKPSRCRSPPLRSWPKGPPAAVVPGDTPPQRRRHPALGRVRRRPASVMTRRHSTRRSMARSPNRPRRPGAGARGAGSEPRPRARRAKEGRHFTPVIGLDGSATDRLLEAAALCWAGRPSARKAGGCGRSPRALRRSARVANRWRLRQPQRLERRRGGAALGDSGPARPAPSRRIAGHPAQEGAAGAGYAVGAARSNRQEALRDQSQTRSRRRRLLAGRTGRRWP